MRFVLGVVLIGLLGFLFVADESPASFVSKLTVLLNGTQYAQGVFLDRVARGGFLASDNSLSADPGEPSCHIAVVELAADAPALPPEVPLIVQDSAQFGGNWRATPAPSVKALQADPLAKCGHKVDRFSRANLEKALVEPGSFFIRDWKNDTLQVYAPRFNLAAHLALK